MADEPKLTPETPPQPNTPEARNPDGTLKDQNPPPTNTDTPAKIDPEPKVEPKATVEGAPEKYAAFTVPEGVALDEKIIGEVSTIFKEANLPQATAQKLIDFHTTQMKAAGEAGFNEYQATREKWRTELTADKDIGSKLPAVKAEIGRMYDGLGDPGLVTAFKEAMDTTGVGDNPAFAKLMYKLAQRFSEGKPVTPGGPSALGQGDKGKPASAAQALYPNLPSATG